MSDVRTVWRLFIGTVIISDMGTEKVKFRKNDDDAEGLQMQIEQHAVNDPNAKISAIWR